MALFDGAGRSYLGRVASLSRDVVTVAIAESLPERESESPLALTLALAVLKADRFDWVIEKATELGIGRILPFLASTAWRGRLRRAAHAGSTSL